MLSFGTNPYFFLIAFTVLGGGVKYVDDAFDEKKFSKKIATLLAPALGVLWAYTCISSEIAATLLLAIMFGVLLKGKIDNLAHQLGFVTIIVLLFLGGAEMMIVPLIVLTVAGALDEVGNDFMEKRTSYFYHSKAWEKFSSFFFGYRLLMKIVVLFITLLGVFPLYFLVAFLLFDSSYHIMHLYSQTRPSKPARRNILRA